MNHFKTASLYLLTIVLPGCIYAMEKNHYINTSTNNCYKDLIILLAYAIVDTAEDTIDFNDNLKQTFKTLQALSQTCKTARIIKKLIFDIDEQAETFNIYLVEKLSRHIKPNNYPYVDSFAHRLTAAYIGTPQALKIYLKKFIMHLANSESIKYVLDGKKINKTRTKYRRVYDGPPSGGRNNAFLWTIEDGKETYEKWETFDVIIAKFPYSTQLFCKELFYKHHYEND